MIVEHANTQMVSQSIHACKDCKYFYEEDNLIPLCKFHYFEKPNYIHGTIEKINMLAFQARESETRCGAVGKNFEQREIDEKEEKYFSLREYLKTKVFNLLYVLGLTK
jgi:hypothetical protein